MKTVVKIGIVLFVLAGIMTAGYMAVGGWMRNKQVPTWRDEEVVQGDITFEVNATGTIQPVMSVQVGSVVSGPIDPNTALVEFNQEVKKGEVLAIIDQRLFLADVARDRAAVDAALGAQKAAEASVKSAEASVDSANAAVKTRLAEVERAKTMVKQAESDETRGKSLAEENPEFISKSELDQLFYNCKQLQDQVNVAIAAVDQARAAVLQAEAGVIEADASLLRATASVAQAEANMTRSELSLDYTEIKSPVDGIVIDRKIEPGQTLAATFQTPELYIIAPNMREEMYVYASVDEADIGLIRDAQLRGNPVQFTVDAYPDDLFEAAIKEVRFSSTSTQNVVTYPVVVSAPNPDLKLLPGMTASISFQVDKKQDVGKIPNAALRFYPDEKYVREEDQKILDGASMLDDDGQNFEVEKSAAQKSEAARKRNTRHVWVADGQMLRAIEVVVGLTDSRFTELVSGDLELGMKLVSGLKK